MGFVSKLFGSKGDGGEEKSEKVVEKVEKAEKVEDLDENQLIIQILKDKLLKLDLQLEVNKEMVVIPSIDSSIGARIRDKSSHENVVIVQLDFFIMNKEFGDDGIYESLAGIGKGENVEEAVENGVDAFIEGTLEPFVNAFQDKYEPELNVETTRDGVTRLWHFVRGPLQIQGSADCENLDKDQIYKLLKTKIEKKLKNKRFYWAKIFVSKQVDGKVICQCLLNNIAFPEADVIMEEYAKSWSSNSYMGLKQYIIIRQCDKSWNENREKDLERENFIKDCAKYAISVFENHSPEDSKAGLINKVAEYTKDVNLAWELFHFIPSIYCRLFMREPKYSEMVLLVMPDESQVFKQIYDFDSYTNSVDVVIEGIQKNNDKNNVQKILFLSDEFKALQRALMNGSKLDDLHSAPMLLMVPEGYILES